MKFFLAILFLLSSIVCFCQAQNPSFKPDVKKDFTPSPTTANLGIYGKSTQVSKSLGAVNESLELFKVTAGDLTYAPKIQYASNGIGIDEWGGRLGIGWTDNFTAVITRVVKSVPDEMASSHIQYISPQDISAVTETNLSRMIALTNAGSMGGADGEYDIFNFNVFGTSGQFIIHEGMAKLLNHQENVKIEIISTNPWKFLITSVNGTKYYFGLNGEREVSTYSNENACDMDSYLGMFINTGWYLSKIVSPKNEEILFGYTDVETEYIYDTNNSVVYHHYAGSDISDFVQNNANHEESQTFCVRTKRSTIPLLSSVQSNNFSIYFNFINRADLHGDKLISEIFLRDVDNTIIKKINFTYSHFISTTFIEPLLDQQISASPFVEQIKSRYFLNKVAIGSASDVNILNYGFEYYFPELLPHRFAFSKDMEGYYNNVSGNYNLMPKYLFEKYKGGYFKARSNYLGANRDINPNTSYYGLLKKIVYPTKGYNEILYESNTYTKLEPQFLSPQEFSGTAYAPAYTPGEWEFYEGEFHIPANQRVVLDVQSDYLDPQLPPGHEFDDYLIRFSIVNFDTGEEVLLPMGNNEYEDVVTKQVFNRYYGEFDLGEGYYGIKVYVSNKRMYFNYSLKYFQDVQMVNVEKPFYGNRVKNIKSYEADHVLLESKEFNYKNIAVNGASMIFSDTTSIVKVSEIPVKFVMNRMIEVYHQVGLPGGGFTSDILVTYPLYVFSSSSTSPMNVYGGNTYLYKNVTEILGDKSFTTSIYEEASNEMLSYINEAIYGRDISYGSTNVGWRNGIEIETMLGGKIDNIHRVKQRTQNFYSQGSNAIYANYIAKKGFEPIAVRNSLDGKYELYSLAYIPTYSVWFRLDSTKTYNYDDISYPIINKVNYSYNPNSRLTNGYNTLDSKGLLLNIRKYGPADMVDNLLDPTGVYQAMLSAFNISPIIRERKSLGNQILSETRSSYLFENGMFLEKSKKVIYDEINLGQTVNYEYNPKGRLIFFKNEKGITSCLLWANDGETVVATIDNCNYSELVTLLGASYINSLYINNNFREIDAISLHEILKVGLPQSEVQTFSYYPLIGMKSKTDSKGMTTYFDYDDFGRLKVVKDQNSNVIKKYDYHYKP